MLERSTPVHRLRGGAVVLLCIATAAICAGVSPALAAWAEGAWPFRRAVDVEWVPDKMTGDELAVADILTLGGHVASGENIRVMSEEGKYVPARVLMIGPGDRMRVLFAPARGVRRHYIYFGHPKAPPPPRGLDDVPIRCGLLMEMRKLEGPLASNFKQIEAAFDRSKRIIGRTMVSRLYLGFNPFNEEVEVVSRFAGTLRCPMDGQYGIAGSASDHAAVYIDGKPVLWIPDNPADIRFNTTVELKRGNHEIVVYHINRVGEQRLTVAWKLPDADRFELIPSRAFGVLPRVTVGALEEKDRLLTADMKIDYIGECFYADHYSHRYRFTAQGAAGSSRGLVPKYEWDFGDGQTAQGQTVEHVFLTDGEYPVKLTARAGLQSDSKTQRLFVSRQYEVIDNPPADVPSAQGKIVAGYDLDKLPLKAAPWACILLERAKEMAALEKIAMRLAGLPGGVELAVWRNTLESAGQALVSDGRIDSAARVWEAVGPQSPLQPFAAKQYAKVMLWRMGNPARTVQLLEPYAAKYPQDTNLQRMYAQALVLNQKVAEGAKILKSMRGEGLPDRKAAIAGALARTIEYYIGEGDVQSGEQQWDRWQQQYPDDFLEGYSVLLRVRLMEIAKVPEAAARIAEAFALAMPRSSYAPRLLDTASRLLAKTDPVKSRALREMLKQKYPEDPLSQEGR